MSKPGVSAAANVSVIGMSGRHRQNILRADCNNNRQCRRDTEDMKVMM